MKMVRKNSQLASKIMIGLIVVVILTATGFTIHKILYENQFFAGRKFEELARKYYEETLYQKFVEEHNKGDLASEFQKHSNGFTVKLRQILNHELLKNDKNYRADFETEAFSCDTNLSNVVFKAYAPYSKKDYMAEFNLNCNKH